MLFLLLLLAVILVGLTVRLALSVVTGSSRTNQNLARIEEYGFGSVEAPQAPETTLREHLNSLAALTGGLLDRFIKTEGDADLRRHLYAAGLYGTTPQQFRGYRALATMALIGFWIWIAIVRGNVALVLFGFLLGGVLGWIGPTFVIKRRAAARLDRIDYAMPELVDLLVTAVEGGLGFTAALQLAARNLEGPLGEELRLALREQHMGLTMNEALSNMLTRTDTTAARSFVQAVVQGETLGVSIGKVLRDLADEMRRRRRQAAEERAHKAGTKILFPLVLLIFPSLFVVTLLPVLISIATNLTGG